MNADPEFDQLSSDYEKLLDDPVREYFAPGSGFFVSRKIDVLREFAERHGVDMARAAWLDVGCGKGDLLRAGRPYFARVAGCDVSLGMIGACRDLDVVHQPDPDRLPFADRSVDWATAVCIFHHIEPAQRVRVATEIRRVLKPGGTFAIVEHNPFNPATQLIVRRTPVDANAMLLTAAAARRLMRDAGFRVVETQYFLYVPERIYAWAASLERVLAHVPLGGQYVVFGSTPN